MKFEIKSRFDASIVLYTAQAESLKDAVVAAVKGGADLRGADLRGAEGEKITLAGERPFLQIGPLGSRCDYLNVFLTDHGVYVRAGCFWNTLAAFSKAVTETHGKTSVHAKEYAAAISQIKLHAKLWVPK